jgi:hypothetical protein
MPQKRISNAQQKVMDNADIVDNIREMSGVKKGFVGGRDVDDKLVALNAKRRNINYESRRILNEVWNDELDLVLGGTRYDNLLPLRLSDVEGKRIIKSVFDWMDDKMDNKQLNDIIREILYKNIRNDIRAEDDFIVDDIMDINFTYNLRREGHKQAFRDFYGVNETVLQDAIPASMREKYGDEKAKEMIEDKLENPNALKNPNKGFKKPKESESESESGAGAGAGAGASPRPRTFFGAIFDRVKELQGRNKPLSSAAPAPAPSNPLLPAGWETTVDPESGNSYYYNRSTGVVSWEPPSRILGNNDED